VRGAWKDDLYSLWQELLYEGEGMRFLRILLAICFVAGIGWSIYLYKQIVWPSRLTFIEIPIAKSAIELDQKHVDLVKGFEEIADIRSINLGMADLASTLTRHAFSEPPMPVVQEAVVKEAAQRDKAPSLAVEQVYLPPHMEVRAIMILDKRPMALMNIEGEGDGLIVSPGYRFGDGRGRVVSITQTKVVVLWAGTSMELGL